MNGCEWLDYRSRRTLTSMETLSLNKPINIDMLQSKPKSIASHCCTRSDQTGEQRVQMFNA
jgi:hypothetical protein